MVRDWANDHKQGCGLKSNFYLTVSSPVLGALPTLFPLPGFEKETYREKIFLYRSSDQLFFKYCTAESQTIIK